MKVREWEIWHTYSTYLSNPPVNLDVAARALVDSGLAPLVMHRDGKTYWFHEGTHATGLTQFDLTPDRHNVEISFQSDHVHADDAGLDGFTAEAWTWAAQFRFCELRVFGDRPFPPAYVRAFMGAFQLTSTQSDFSVVVYPIIKLFDSGEVLLEFRVIGPNRDMPLGQFIERHVNLYQVPFDQVKVSPAVSKLSTEAYYKTAKRWPIHFRAAINWLQRRHDTAVAEHTELTETGDFHFPYAPLARDDEGYDTLATLTQTIFHVLGYVIGKPRTGWRYLLRGNAPHHDVGEYWVGRPHVHLIRFDGQSATASETLTQCRTAFGQIFLRGVVNDEKVATSVLPEDARLFDDYNALVAAHMSLWAWSEIGLRQQEPWADPNRGHLVYEHQAVTEMLDYGYISNRALFDHAGAHRDLDTVLQTKLATSKLKQDLREASQSGEIRQLLEQAWNDMGVAQLQVLIDDILATREAQTSVREARGSNRVSRRLTVLFGLIAVPPLAELVLRPLWNFLDWWLPNNADAASLLLIGVAIVIVVGLFFLTSVPRHDVDT